MIEDIYRECINRIIGLIKRNGSHKCPEDYVNEAFLQLANTGSEITIETLYKESRNIFLSELQSERMFLGGTSRKTNKVCPKCKDEFPIAFFGIVKRKDGSVRPGDCCRNCQRQKSIIYPKDKAKENLKRRVDGLTDGYIRKVLRACGMRNDLISVRDIERKRQQILRKRDDRIWPKNLRRDYIKRVMTACGYKYREITEEQVNERRLQIIRHRYNRDKLESNSFEFPL